MFCQAILFDSFFIIQGLDPIARKREGRERKGRAGVTKSIQDEGPWYTLFVDIVLVDETRCDDNVKLIIWRDALESKAFWLCRTKQRQCTWNVRLVKVKKKDEGVVSLPILDK